MAAPRSALCSPVMPADRPDSKILSLALLLQGCATGVADAPQAPAPAIPQHPLVAESIGVERILSLAHPSCAGHFGVDVLRRPRLDEQLGETRDDWLFAIAGGPACMAALVDDQWNVKATVAWPTTGQSVPWSDVKLYRHIDAKGQARDFVYYCSRGTPLLEITEVTNFPEIKTVTMPIDPGVPVKVHGAHTLQIHQERGVLVLNGVHVEAEPMPAPLTPAAAPALFYDLTKDPLQPQRVSMYVGPDAGDQTLFDSQFLTLDGKDVWAPTIAQPLRNAQSYFAFYEFVSAEKMTTQPRLAYYAGPATGSFHNVVQLLPTPDGKQRLAAGFEAWAYAATKPEQIISKCGILDFTALMSAEMPELVAWLVDDNNRKHATHNPAFRMAEHKSHTYDTIPLAHFTGGYRIYQCRDDQASVSQIAFVPLATQFPGEGGGRKNPRMNIGEWLKVYNGAWDVVATPIGDLCSSTDREASFLIEPTWGFVRQFGTYIARDSVPPRLWVVTGVPEAGQPMRIGMSGVKPGDHVRLLVATRAHDVAVKDSLLGAMWCDRTATVAELEGTATSTTHEFTLGQAPKAAQLWMVASVDREDGSGIVAKSPTTTVRVRDAQ